MALASRPHYPHATPQREPPHGPSTRTLPAGHFHNILCAPAPKAVRALRRAGLAWAGAREGTLKSHSLEVALAFRFPRADSRAHAEGGPSRSLCVQTGQWEATEGGAGRLGPANGLQAVSID